MHASIIQMIAVASVAFTGLAMPVNDNAAAPLVSRNRVIDWVEGKLHAYDPQCPKACSFGGTCPLGCGECTSDNRCPNGNQ